MDRKSLNKHDIDTLISMIEELKIDPLLYKTNGKCRKKGDACRNKRMLISHIIKHDPPVERKEPPEALGDENKMYKWCRMYASTDNFMNELYTKEEADKAQAHFDNNKKLIALHLWSNFSIKQKINMFKSKK